MPLIIGTVLVNELCSAYDISFIFVVVRIVKILFFFRFPIAEGL